MSGGCGRPLALRACSWRQLHPPVERVLHCGCEGNAAMLCRPDRMPAGHERRRVSGGFDDGRMLTDLYCTEAVQAGFYYKCSTLHGGLRGCLTTG